MRTLKIFKTVFLQIQTSTFYSILEIGIKHVYNFSFFFWLKIYYYQDLVQVHNANSESSFQHFFYFLTFCSNPRKRDTSSKRQKIEIFRAVFLRIHTSAFYSILDIGIKHVYNFCFFCLEDVYIIKTIHFFKKEFHFRP